VPPGEVGLGSCGAGRAYPAPGRDSLCVESRRSGKEPDDTDPAALELLDPDPTARHEDLVTDPRHSVQKGHDQPAERLDLGTRRLLQIHADQLIQLMETGSWL
jgi:hypothetical protein